MSEMSTSYVICYLQKYREFHLVLLVRLGETRVFDVAANVVENDAAFVLSQNILHLKFRVVSPFILLHF